METKYTHYLIIASIVIKLYTNIYYIYYNTYYYYYIFYKLLSASPTYVTVCMRIYYILLKNLNEPLSFSNILLDKNDCIFFSDKNIRKVYLIVYYTVLVKAKNSYNKIVVMIVIK